MPLTGTDNLIFKLFLYFQLWIIFWWKACKHIKLLPRSLIKILDIMMPFSTGSEEVIISFHLNIININASQKQSTDRIVPYTLIVQRFGLWTIWSSSGIVNGRQQHQGSLVYTEEILFSCAKGFPGGPVVKNPPAMQEIQVRSLGRSPREGTHSNILAWEIPWTEEPDGLQSMV